MPSASKLHINLLGAGTVVSDWIASREGSRVSKYMKVQSGRDLQLEQNRVLRSTCVIKVRRTDLAHVQFWTPAHNM